MNLKNDIIGIENKINSLKTLSSLTVDTVINFEKIIQDIIMTIKDITQIRTLEGFLKVLADLKILINDF